MKLDKKCIEAIKEAAGVGVSNEQNAIEAGSTPEEAGTQDWFTSEAGDGSGYELRAAVVIVPESECEFWAHKAARNLAIDLAHEAGPPDAVPQTWVNETVAKAEEGVSS